MIEKLTRKSVGHSSVPVCRIDFDIWDRVLSHHPGMRLEAISRADDRRDAELMFARTDARGEPPEPTGGAP